MWFIPNTVGSFWGGWHNPTKILQFLLPLNPGKSIFISPALNEYTSLLFLFFFENRQLIHRLASRLSPTNTIILKDYSQNLTKCEIK